MLLSGLTQFEQHIDETVRYALLTHPTHRGLAEALLVMAQAL